MPNTCFPMLARGFAAALVVIICAVAGNLSVMSAVVAQALDKVTFATNWVPEPEHGDSTRRLPTGPTAGMVSTSPSFRAART